MQIIHSFSTIPFQKKHDDILDIWKNVLLYATSTAYVHNVLHLPITLYVNSEGKKFFDFIPYDNIVEMEPDETINDIFWASYKMQALQKSEKDSIHIDGDVFILDKNLGDIIKNNDKYDILVQSIDCKDKTTSTYIKTFISYFENLKFLKKYCPNFDTEIFDTNNFDFTNSLNTGVLGFSHDDMKQEWCDKYFNAVHKLSPLLKNLTSTEKEMSPDIIVEQMHLSRIYKDKNVKMLVDNWFEPKKYMHVYGSYKDAFIKNILGSLNLQDKKTFIKFMNMFSSKVMEFLASDKEFLENKKKMEHK